MLECSSKLSGLFSSIKNLKLTKNRDCGEFGEQWKGAIFTEYATSILLYLSLLELKHIAKFPQNFDVIADASSSRLSWVSVKLKQSLFDNPISLNISSKRFHMI